MQAPPISLPSEELIQRVVRRAPWQYRKAEQDGYFPSRRNGWSQHAIVFNANVEELQRGKGRDVFVYNSTTGEISVERDGYLLRIELWWKGRAPWGYHSVRLIRNGKFKGPEIDALPDDHCGLKEEECRLAHSCACDVSHRRCAQTGFWSSGNGHVVANVYSRAGDTFLATNWPAHIQGTPAIFELRLSAYLITGRDTQLALAPVADPFKTLIEQLDSRPDAAATVELFVNHLASSNSLKFGNAPTNGQSVRELLTGARQRLGPANSAESAKLENLSTALCPNFHAHANDENPSDGSGNVCWACRSPLDARSAGLEERAKKTITAQDEESFGLGFPHDADTYEKASLAALERGVCVRWLEAFTNYHDCWAWPTWRVAEQIVKPATGQSRRRFVEMPGIAQAAKVGRTDIFLSHAWGGTWGDLVAAALNCIEQEDEEDEEEGGGGGEAPTVRVYIDVFAVRQWPGNVCDIVFAGVVKHATLSSSSCHPKSSSALPSWTSRRSPRPTPLLTFCRPASAAAFPFCASGASRKSTRRVCKTSR